MRDEKSPHELKLTWSSMCMVEFQLQNIFPLYCHHCFWSLASNVTFGIGDTALLQIFSTAPELNNLK